MRILSIMASLACAASALAQFTGSNVELYKHMPISQFGAQHTSANDCWGYVSPSGREYAIAGLSHGVAFVEITNPGSPVIVAQVAHSGSLWGSIRVYGHHCYVGNESGGGVQVISLANIDNGSVQLVRTLTGQGLQTVHTMDVDPVSGFLYMAGSSTISPKGLAAYSLADPSNPVRVGYFNPGYVHEATVTTYTSGPYAGKQIAFCFSGYTGLEIVDVTVKKSNMPLLARRAYTGLGYCHQGWLSADKKYLYVDDEFDELNGDTPTTRTLVFDVSNINSPFLASTFTTGKQSIDHNQYTHNGFLYQSNYTSGVFVWDLTNPTAPTMVGSFDTYPPTHPHFEGPGDGGANDFDGTWTNYPFFPSGTWIATDITYGLFVLDPTAARHCLDADFTSDGFVSGDDFDAYVAAFELGLPSADFNGDGFVTGDDFDEFAVAFERGC